MCITNLVNFGNHIITYSKGRRDVKHHFIHLSRRPFVHPSRHGLFIRTGRIKNRIRFQGPTFFKKLLQPQASYDDSYK